MPCRSPEVVPVQANHQFANYLERSQTIDPFIGYAMRTLRRYLIIQEKHNQPVAFSVKLMGQEDVNIVNIHENYCIFSCCGRHIQIDKVYFEFPEEAFRNLEWSLTEKAEYSLSAKIVGVQVSVGGDGCEYLSGFKLEGMQGYVDPFMTADFDYCEDMTADEQVDWGKSVIGKVLHFNEIEACAWYTKGSVKIKDE